MLEHKPTALQPQRGWSCVGVERSAKLNWGRTPEQEFKSQSRKDAKVSEVQQFVILEATIDQSVL
jgi:hypothetical protein